MFRQALYPSNCVGRGWNSVSLPPVPPLAPALPPPSEEHIPISPFDAAPGVDIFDENGGPDMLFEGSSAVSVAIPICFLTVSAYPREVADPTLHFYTHPRPPPTSLPSTFWK